MSQIQSSLRQILPDSDGILKLDPGAKIQIWYIPKATKERQNAPISVGPKANVYFALFPEDDVDFEITIDNTSSKDRSLCVELEIHQRVYSFVVKKASRGTLQTFESNGRKFHFLRQSSEDGEALVSTVAALHRMSFEAAAVMISQIKFTTKYSKRERPLLGSIVKDSVVIDGSHHPQHSNTYRRMMEEVEQQHDEEKSERGAICFGERSSQQFSKMAFDVDPSIVVEPFIIEMRLKSRFVI